MLIKICGITNLADAQLVAQTKADFLGFIFTDSPRQVSPETAAEISSKLPSGLKKVGVFVNEKKETIIDVAKQCSLDYIQLHGEESQEFCRELPLPVIKAVRISQPEDLPLIKKYPNVAYILIDKPLGKKQFLWSLFPETRRYTNLPIFLAGGLNPDNLAIALQYHPDGIDVASGVEAYPGKKDPALLSTFLKLARLQSRSSN